MFWLSVTVFFSLLCKTSFHCQCSGCLSLCSSFFFLILKILLSTFWVDCHPSVKRLASNPYCCTNRTHELLRFVVKTAEADFIHDSSRQWRLHDTARSNLLAVTRLCKLIFPNSTGLPASIWPPCITTPAGGGEGESFRSHWMVRHVKLSTGLKGVG